MGTPASPTRIIIGAATNFNDILQGEFGASRPKYSIFTSEVYRIDLYQQGVLGIASGLSITDNIDIIPGEGSSLHGTAHWIDDYAYGISYRLLRDSNNNGTLDSADTLIDYGTPKTDANGEIVMRNNASAGIYFVEINDANGNGVSRTQSSLVFDPGLLNDTPMQGSDFNGDFRNGVPVYRFYNQRSGVHLYTPDAGERDSVIRNSYGEGTSFEKLRANPSSADPLTGGWGYKFEGIAYQALDTQGTALFRFYNADKGYHFLSSSKEEANNVIKNSLGSGYDLNNAVNKDPITGGWGYRYEGTTYRVSTSAQQGINQAVYRFYNVNKGVHFYTASSDERDTVIRQSIGANYVGRLDQAYNAPLINGGWGYKYEGISWYI